jgi:hypothetical protein
MNEIITVTEPVMASLNPDVHSNLHGVTDIPPIVKNLNFDRLKHKETESTEASLSPDEWDAAEIEYRRFLTLKYFYRTVPIVPNKLVDKIWHAHILDTRAYRSDCNQVFGHFMEHYPYFGIYGENDYQMLQKSFEITVALYERHFGPYARDNDATAARCAGHPCHAPSSCACRAPGTCN